MNNIMEILDMLQFFGGQRSGRELWAYKPTDVQDADIESFNKNINAIRDYIQQLEAQNAELLEKVEKLKTERDSAVADLKKAANEKGECFGCKWYNGKNCTNKDYKHICSPYDDKWEWRGVQKEETI